LVGLCETRFIERNDTINVFFGLLEPIIISLQDIQETHRSVSSSASSFLAAVEKTRFIISLLVCEHLLNFTLPLSHYLQNPAVFVRRTSQPVVFTYFARLSTVARVSKSIVQCMVQTW